MTASAERCWRFSRQGKENGGLDIQFQGETKQGRPKRGYLDVVQEDVQEVGMREDEVFARSVWRILCYGHVLRREEEYGQDSAGDNPRRCRG